MKKIAALFVLPATLFGGVLLDCGEPRNFRHEFSLTTEPAFSTVQGEWAFYKYGVRKDARHWTANATFKGPIVENYTLLEPGRDGRVTRYLFKDLKGCFLDIPNPARLVILSRGLDGKDRLERVTQCGCKSSD